MATIVRTTDVEVKSPSFTGNVIFVGGNTSVLSTRVPSAKAESVDQETQSWSSLADSAFARDWDSEADSRHDHVQPR
jgi:hypothetical protein